jgi:signal recognition particle receptor subunit beta
MASSDPNQQHELLLTNARLAISPYLSPPILQLIKRIDTNDYVKRIIPHPTYNKEPSMVLLATILGLYLLRTLLRIATIIVKKGNKPAIDGLDTDAPEDNVLNLNSSTKLKDYKDLVVLFGPERGGKTVLFHSLLTAPGTSSRTSIPSTVMSLKANIAVVTPSSTTTSSDKIRIVDYPGHITLSSQLPTLLNPSKLPSSSSSSSTVRGILVIDATKPVSAAASLLYDVILTNDALRTAWEMQETKFHILVCCHKSDATNAKNWRRIKIQLRSELEKLKKISQKVSSASGRGGDSLLSSSQDSTSMSMNMNVDMDMGGDGDGGVNQKKFELVGKTIDLDDLGKNGLPMIQLSFLSTSCIAGDGTEGEGEGMRELKAFVERGEILAQNSSAFLRSKVR